MQKIKLLKYRMNVKKAARGSEFVVVMKSIRNMPYHQAKKKLGQMQSIDATRKKWYILREIYI